MSDLRIWDGADDVGVYPVARTLERIVEAPRREDADECRVTAECQRRQIGHPSTYGLLGAVFVPDGSGLLTVRVSLSEKVVAGQVQSVSPPGSRELRYPGMSDESYAQGIYQAVMVPAEVAALGSGLLTFDRAIQDLVCSSAMIFGWLALALVRYIEQNCPPREQMGSLIDAAIHDATERVRGQLRPGAK